MAFGARANSAPLDVKVPAAPFHRECATRLPPTGSPVGNPLKAISPHVERVPLRLAHRLSCGRGGTTYPSTRLPRSAATSIVAGPDCRAAVPPHCFQGTPAHNQPGLAPTTGRQQRRVPTFDDIPRRRRPQGDVLRVRDDAMNVHVQRWRERWLGASASMAWGRRSAQSRFAQGFTRRAVSCCLRMLRSWRESPYGRRLQ